MNFPIPARRLLKMPVKTIVAAPAKYSPGAVNEFYSEADYWWPPSSNPWGSYIRRDGISNPDCFNRHRKLLIRMSCQAAGLTEAFLDNRDPTCLLALGKLLKAWFIAPESAMAPHLRYAQAIRNCCRGRSYGIIDTIHLAECALAVHCLRRDLPGRIISAVREWFGSYLKWMCTSKSGQEERAALNNHSVCWYLQAAAFARLLDDPEKIAEFRADFKHKLLKLIAADGALPAELERSKPYGYMLFTTDAFAGLAALLSDEKENFFYVAGEQRQSVAGCINYIVPYVTDKKNWKMPPDVLYFDCWPCRQASLYLGAEYMNRPDYLALWKRLPECRTCFEVLRNFPIRHPRLWKPSVLSRDS